MAKKSYSAKDIDVLNEADKVRKNKGMYLGLQEKQNLQCLKEVVDNTVDMFISGMNNYCKVIVTNTKNSQVFTIVDHGPGIPVEIHPKTKMSTLTTVMTTLHAGSNFDKAEKGKDKRRGKHGVGVSCVNAVSQSLIVNTNRKGIWHSQEYSKGVAITDVKKAKKSMLQAKKGTQIKFELDYSIMPKNKLTYEEVYEYLEVVALLNTGFKVELQYDNKPLKTFLNKKGIISALDKYKGIHKKASWIGKPFVLETENLDITFQWGDIDSTENYHSFVNSGIVAEGGTHLNGAYASINNLFKANSKAKAKFTINDLKEGLLLVIHYRTDEDEYAGQSKERLNTSSATADVKNILEKPLAAWIDKNQKLVRQIITRASEISKAKLQAKALTKVASTVKSNAKQSLMLPGKLARCDKKTPPKDVELLLVEGDSAGGVVKKARNPKFQEVLSCRGKGLNIVKATLAKILANKEIASIAIAISGSSTKDIVKTGTLSKFRIGKILLMPDADVDGEHISVLWVATLLKIAPAAFEAGMVYKILSPLYIDSEDKSVYGFSLKEIQDKMKPQHYNRIVRCKGLGEFTDAQLEPFINPETRRVVQLSRLTDKEINEFERLMGSDTAYRKVLLDIKDRQL